MDDKSTINERMNPKDSNVYRKTITGQTTLKGSNNSILSDRLKQTELHELFKTLVIKIMKRIWVVNLVFK